MATRSTISVVTKEGQINSIYCHHDGYVDGVGLTLMNHYNSYELASELVGGGDLSVLGSKIKPDLTCDHTFENPQQGVCFYYGRDGQEPYTGYEQFESYLEYRMCCDFQEFNYLFHEGEWHVYNQTTKSLEPLKNLLT